MQVFKNPSVGNRRRQILAEEVEEGTERPGHGQDICHIVLLLLRQKEILRLVRAPQIFHRRIIRPPKNSLADVSKNKPLQEQPHPAGDGRSRTVDEHDLAFVLQTPEVRSARGRKRQAYALRRKECFHARAQGGDRLFTFRREVPLEVKPHGRIL